MRPIPSPLRTVLLLLAVFSLTACASAFSPARTTSVTAYNCFATGQAGPPEEIPGCVRRGFVATTATATGGSAAASHDSLVETLRQKAERAGANTLVVAYAGALPLSDEEGTRLRGVAFSCPAGVKVPGAVVAANF